MIMSNVLTHFDAKDDLYIQTKKKLNYLVVDEYQDINPIQERIVQSIYEMGANVCIVGDDDQNIYQWRGSDINYIFNFHKKYNNVHQVKLEENFRSSKGIIDVAQKIIKNNTIRIPKEMQYPNSEKFDGQIYEREDIIYNDFENEKEELKFISKTINNLLGVKFQDGNKVINKDTKVILV